LFCVKVKNRELANSRPSYLKMPKTIMKKTDTITNVHGFNPKPAGSIDKTINWNRMTLH
jgi:hypothetical protein